MRIMAKKNSLETDVAIIGGSMVGLTLALALAQAGLRSTVIDPLPARAQTDTKFDGRVCALAFATCRMYQALGVWEAMAPDAQPINDIMVTDGTVKGGASPLFLHYDHREIGDQALGHILENRHNRRALFEAVAANDRIRLISPAKSVSITRMPNGAEVALDTGQTIHARLVAGCDGRGSPTRRAAGIKTVSWTYKQSGIVTTVEHAQPHEGIAQEYFLPSGPFAILPMTGNRASLVWTERSDLVDGMMALDEDAFNAEIAARFGDYLGEVRAVGPRFSYPLGLQLARDYIAERLVLVGDAAHGVHPIAGQGLNLGLRDVAALADVLAEGRGLGLDPGDFTMLERYQQWRRFDNTALALTMDGLNRLFSNDIGPLRLARDVGLSLVGKMPPLRRLFMRHAAGDVGDLPRLLKGISLAA